jgi:exodeoxyribonuclease VII large subunit
MQPRPDEVILSVSELNRVARDLLETALPGLWVEGEISNFVHHGSGHMYFNLKDEQAQIRCAMFRRANQRLNFRPEDGLQILLQGKVTIYEPRGSYQIVAEQMEPAGEGLLRRQFEALKARLQAEGLFSDEHKQPLIVIYPAQVQGERARSELAAALATAGRRNECDVLICGRGGGSLEDLWSFNEEQVVRAIFDCPIPVISAVGHESDITLADLVADVRAPTPSAAAELAVPDASEWQQQIARLTRRGTSAVQRSLRQRAALHTNLAGRLRRRNPGYLLRQNAQRIDELGLRLRRSALQRINTERARLLHANARLAGASPSARCRETGHRLQGHRLRMITALRTRLAATRARLGTLAASLNVASPLATLERGYAIVTDAKTGHAVTDAGRLKPGDTVDTRLAKGRFAATVSKVSPEKSK